MPPPVAPFSDVPSYMQPVTKERRRAGRAEDKSGKSDGSVESAIKGRQTPGVYHSAMVAEKERKRSVAEAKAAKKAAADEKAAEEHRAYIEEQGDLLRAAASNGNAEEVASILKQRGQSADVVDATNYEGLTALMKASMYGHDKVITTLLSAGADVNLTDDRGRTSLMLAAQNGEKDAVYALLHGGARPLFGPAEHGMTAIMLASIGGHAEVVKLLLQAGAPTDAVDNEGRTAKEIAEAEGHKAVIDLFQSHAEWLTTHSNADGWKKLRRLSAAASVASALNAKGELSKDQHAGRFAKMLQGKRFRRTR